MLPQGVVTEYCQTLLLQECCHKVLSQSVVAECHRALSQSVTERCHRGCPRVFVTVSSQSVVTACCHRGLSNSVRIVRRSVATRVLPRVLVWSECCHRVLVWPQSVATGVSVVTECCHRVLAWSQSVSVVRVLPQSAVLPLPQGGSKVLAVSIPA